MYRQYFLRFESFDQSKLKLCFLLRGWFCSRIIASGFPPGNPFANRVYLPVLCGKISIDINAICVDSCLRSRQETVGIDERRNNNALIFKQSGIIFNVMGKLEHEIDRRQFITMHAAYK